MDKLIAWLPTAAPPAAEPRLIHGDYSFHNLLIHPTEPRVARAGLGALDHRRSAGRPDLPRHGVVPARRRRLARQPAGLDLAALGDPGPGDLRRPLLRAGGPPPLENLGFYKAYNLFRVAAIVQGIVGRARQGNAAAAARPSRSGG
jgi:aminoglycoside phosphotransferase (APT) family kinase protein